MAQIVSGGQSGVDRAALDAAIEVGVPYGGWCPAGGGAEDHPQPPGVRAQYPRLRETRSADPAVRTELNVRDSDATLVLLPRGEWHSPGTDLTVACCRRSGRPHLVVPVEDRELMFRWLRDLPEGTVLNVAGPRESQSPGIYRAAAALVRELLRERSPRSTR